MCKVALGGIEYDCRVEEAEERCLPACTRRRSEGEERLVRRARRERRVEMEVEGGMVRGIVDVPDTFLTKICIVSSVSDAAELRLELLDEWRMMCGLLWMWLRLKLREGDVEKRQSRGRDDECVRESAVAVAALD